MEQYQRNEPLEAEEAAKKNPEEMPVSQEGPQSALTGVVQWGGHRATKRKATGPIPGQDICLGCVHKIAHGCFSLTLVFLSLSFSLPSPLSKDQ